MFAYTTRARRLAVVVAACALSSATACAQPAARRRTRVASAALGSGSLAGARGDSPRGVAGTTALPQTPALRHSSDTIPGGITCLLRLRALGVPHRQLGAMAYVTTPVLITGPIRGLRLVRMGQHRAVCDCRLALALARAAPLFRALGVEALHFSNAYSRRAVRRGRVSRHRMGLAIDVHRLRVAGRVLRVKRDYRRGESGECGGRAALGRLACELKRRKLFQYVLTPDTNAAHYDHFHLSILSLDRRRYLHKRRAYPVATD